MKKIFKYLVFILIFIFMFFRIGKWTGFLQNYYISTSANEPSLNTDELIFATNLITPKRLDFIVYEQYLDNEFLKGNMDWVHRLCAIENDTLQIKNGILFVNNKEIDSKLILKHEYKISFKEFSRFAKKLNLNESNSRIINKDTVVVKLTKIEAKRLNKKFEDRIIHQPEIEKQFHEKWSVDNFGPVIIPENYLFVIGDNRNGSFDSRYNGFISVDRLKGVVINN